MDAYTLPCVKLSIGDTILVFCQCFVLFLPTHIDFPGNFDQKKINEAWPSFLKGLNFQDFEGYETKFLDIQEYSRTDFIFQDILGFPGRVHTLIM